MSTTYTTVFERGQPVIDMAGTYLYNPFKSTDRLKISKTMANRLVKYARKELEAYGFPTEGKVRVEATVDPHDRIGDAIFQVSFVNHLGGVIGVKCILLKDAKPFVDHGPFIDRE